MGEFECHQAETEVKLYWLRSCAVSLIVRGNLYKFLKEKGIQFPVISIH